MRSVGCVRNACMALLPDRPIPGSTAPDAVDSSPAALQVLDLDVLLSTAAGDQLLAWELIRLFTELAEPIFQRLNAAMLAGDCAASQHQSHALCGAAGLIGATALIPILKNIEVLSFQRRPESVGAELPALMLAYAAVMAAAAHMLKDVELPRKTIL